MHAERLDGFVGLAGCDKSIPAMLMAAARLDLPSVFVYNGSIMPGEHNGVALDITSVFEAVGACARRQDHRGRARRDRAQGLPGRGCVRRDVHRQHDELDRRGDRHVAARHGVAAGGRPPPRGRRAPRRRGRRQHAAARHHAARDHDQAGVRERDRGHRRRSAARPTRCCTCWRSPTRPASSCDLDDFNRIAAKVPHIADMKPGGKFHMSDLDRVGGVPVVMKHLLDAGLLHGDVHDRDRQDDGREPRRDRPAAPRRRRRVPARPADPREGGINVLTGSLAPKGAVVKVAGLTKEQMRVRGHRRGCSTARTGRWTRSSPARSSPAPCWSSATRARRAGRACARCWPSPAR